jgi:hypothetical protein
VKKDLKKALTEMDHTLTRTDPVTALRLWRLRATKAALRSLQESARKSRKGAGK